MNIRIQSVKFDADKKLLDFAQAKLEKLGHFSERITGAEMIMKLDRDEQHGNKVVVTKLEVPGEELVAEFRTKSFEESIDECVDALRKQIEKWKNKA